MVRIQCPVCSQQFKSEESRIVPFCSDRCQQLDLGRWLNEEYSISRIPDPEDESEIESWDVESGHDAERAM